MPTRYRPFVQALALAGVVWPAAAHAQATQPAPSPAIESASTKPHSHRLDHQAVAYLGVATEAINPKLSAALGIPRGTGLLVRQSIASGPAAKAGVQVGDVLIRLNDQMLVNPSQLAVLVRMGSAGEQVTVHLIRSGERHALEAVLDEHQAAPLGPGGQRLSAPRLLGQNVLSGLPHLADAGGIRLDQTDQEHLYENAGEPGYSIQLQIERARDAFDASWSQAAQASKTDPVVLRRRGVSSDQPSESTPEISGLLIDVPREGHVEIKKRQENGQTVTLYEGTLPLPEDAAVDEEIRSLLKLLEPQLKQTKALTKP